jgi:hypothetical protein
MFPTLPNLPRLDRITPQLLGTGGGGPGFGTGSPGWGIGSPPTGGGGGGGGYGCVGPLCQQRLPCGLGGPCTSTSSSTSNPLNPLSYLPSINWGRIAAFLLGLLLIAGGLYLIKDVRTTVNSNVRTLAEAP